MPQTAVDFLTAWFADHCDGEWEHDLGISIETLDNPGWALDVRLEDTELEGVVADWRRVEKSAGSWLHWRSTGAVFEARCGVADLTTALEAFRNFASSAR